MKCYAAAATNIGKRETNQDSAYVMTTQSPNHDVVVFALVSDGMGGLQSGEIASATVAKHFAEWFKAKISDVSLLDFLSIKEEWSRYVTIIAERFIEAGKEKGATMGTTLTALIVVESRYLFAHIGDTRLYRITSDGISVLTEDHTKAARLVREGEITATEAETHQSAHVLTRCIGAKRLYELTFGEGRIDGDVTFLLCSDGFRHYNSKSELYAAFINAQSNFMLHDSIKECINRGIYRGETDNSTAVAVCLRK